MSWKVKIRKTCKICKKPLEGRFRTFCSSKCRNRHNYLNGGKERCQKWQRNKRGEKREGKIQCLICEKWYFQLGSHVVQRHKMTAREYREEFGFDVKTGKATLAVHLHELYGKQAKENGTEKNLKAGKKFWFKKGDKRAGKYERSDQTKERLKVLYTYNKK